MLCQLCNNHDAISECSQCKAQTCNYCERQDEDCTQVICGICKFNEDRSPFMQTVKQIVFGTDFEITRYS
jgi:hypothetical protein